MNILECRGLAKSYGPVRALDGVSFGIEPGRIVGLWILILGLVLYGAVLYGLTVRMLHRHLDLE